MLPAWGLWGRRPGLIDFSPNVSQRKTHEPRCILHSAQSLAAERVEPLDSEKINKKEMTRLVHVDVFSRVGCNSLTHLC